MKTFDGLEINTGDTVYNEHGESLLVSELFPQTEGEKTKLIVIPQYLVESMYAHGDGGTHCEVDVECDFEAEPKVIFSDRVFSVAPTAKISKDITNQRKVLGEICECIGLAQVMRMKEEKDLRIMKAELELFKKKFEETKKKAAELMDSTIRNLCN